MLCFIGTQKERRVAQIPEGPELKHSRDRLRELLAGKRFRKLEIVGGRYAKKAIEGMSDFVLETNGKSPTIDSVDVKGKFMWWVVGEWKLFCTYGMSGQWTRAAVDKNTAVSIWVDDSDGSNLFRINFRDPRRFGTLKFVKNDRELQKKLDSLGPDILSDTPMTSEIFAKSLLIKPNRTIAEALMDQSCVSGVGNYLKAETLYRSRISPHRRVIDMSAKEIYSLWQNTIDSAKESYLDHGASIRTYKTVEDTAGRGQFYFRVYSKKKCPENHDVVSEDTKDGRTSWWCPNCQT
jgi:DNA-formamidopyrimidine glycosylase